jgi:M6 family metalloprotease-like protein
MKPLQQLLSLISFIGMICFYQQAYGAFLENVPISLQQPNGQVIQVFTSGDEYHQRVHDANNYTILQDPVNGYYLYAEKTGATLQASQYQVGEVDPLFTELIPGVDISPEEWKQIRADFWENTPARPVLPGSASNPTLNTGTLNNIVVYIRFSDQTEFSTSFTTYDNMFNNVTSGYNSMQNYFSEVSYNQLTISSNFYPPPSGSVIVSFQDSHPRAYYMPYNVTTNPTGYQNDTERTSREHTLLADAITAIASQVPAGLDVDFDDNNYVDNVCFVVKGATTAWNTLLWPHMWSLYSQTVYINGKRVWDFNFQLEDHTLSSGNGVLCHEMFHTLGAPDLYHYSYDGFIPVGGWDVMQSNTNPPQSMGAWMKYKYGGWISSIPTISTNGTYTLNPITSATNNAYKFASTLSSTEFFILEYRRKTGPFENSIPASGLLIYRINTLAGNGNAGGPPDEVYLYRLNGTPAANGTISSAHFVEGGRTNFNSSSNPYCFFSNGDLADIDISNVGAAGSTISFTVTMPTAAGFSANTTSICPGQSVIFTDESVGGPISWAWSFSPNTVNYIDGTSSSSQNPHVQFTASGAYTVSLTAGYSGGPVTKTKSNYILVKPEYLLPFSENFESGSFATNYWSVTNPDGSYTWSLLNQAAGNSPGVYCPWMDFYSYSGSGQADYLNSPLINLSTYSSAKLTFKLAYRPYSASYVDSLKVQVYSNCGETLLGTIYGKTGLSLGTGGYLTTEFTPSVAGDWRTDTVVLNSYIGNVITLKFKSVNGFGNNLYIDDIGVSGVKLLPDFSAATLASCVDASIAFSDNSTGGATAWLWNFGDGSTSTAQHPSHSYSSSGTYNVSLTISKGAASNTMTKTGYITISDNLWTGGASGNWETAGNWCRGVPTGSMNIEIPSGSNVHINTLPASPAVCSNLTIASGGGITIEAGKALTVNGVFSNNAGVSGLTINSDAGGTGSLLHNSAGVNGTIKRYITGSSVLTDYKYHLVSVPLVPANNSTSQLFTGSYLYAFDVATNAWVGTGTSTTTALDETRGYMIYYPGSSHTYEFSGALNSGVFGATVIHAGNDFNLVPNPYPSAIDWDAASGWTKTNIANSIWTFSPAIANYAAYVNGVSNNGGSQYIAAGQAFFIQATNASPVLSMNDAVRLHNTQAFWKTAETIPNVLRITAESNNFKDEAVVRFADGTSNAIDPEYDAPKMFGLENAPQVYTLTNVGEKLSINSLPPTIGSTVIPLEFETNFNGPVVLSASGIETFDGTTAIFLNDLLTNHSQNLRVEPIYSFVHDTANSADRFRLVFNMAAGVGEQHLDEVNAWYSDGTLYISSSRLAGSKAVLEVYNNIGQLISARQIVLTELFTTALDFNGMAVICLVTDKEVIRLKAIR